MPKKQYAINEVFYSLQGEGARAGTANVFLRFSGCNLQCDIAPGPLSPGGFKCDTEFVSGSKLSIDEIILAIKRVDKGCGWVICTGGEPLLQLDEELINILHLAGYKIAIETNGTRPIPDGIDWVTVSPKVAEHALEAKRADELKYVRALGQAIPRPSIKADHYFISPAWGQDGTIDRATLEHCIKLCLENQRPHPWRLAMQLHKIWNVR